MKRIMFLTGLAVVTMFLGVVSEPVFVKPKAEMAVFLVPRTVGASKGAPDTPLDELNLKMDRVLSILRRIDAKLP